MTATSPTAPLGAVRDAWAAVLGHQDFGDDENFNRVGGHSGAALRISKILRTELGRPVPIKLLFANPTVRGQAEALTGTEAAATETARA
ncbi:acyl carrier protein [Kitasatospora sp. NPDC101183]|uniref:acyl carrier protein n=1 Tax=Kitasatospora sp. NPDC101183 TaxID=3364100 RepID=UPI003815E878